MKMRYSLLCSIFLVLFYALFYIRVIMTRKESQVIKGTNLNAPYKGATQLTLFVSYWADHSNEPHLHRREIEAAIAVNIANCEIGRVVVLLDSSNFLYNCSRFAQEIQLKLSLLSAKCASQFECLDRYEGQPSYYDIFSYAKNLGLERSIYIVANADMVFDETIGLARKLSKKVLLVLGTQGMHSGTPADILRSYKKLTGFGTLPSLPNLCKRRNSWDAWIFHPNDIELNKRYFRDSQTKLLFYMNQNRAENSALNALLESSKGLISHNACDFIHAWHFHGAAKTHKKGVGAVVHKRSKPSTCSSVQHCLHYTKENEESILSRRRVGEE